MIDDDGQEDQDGCQVYALPTENDDDMVVTRREHAVLNMREMMTSYEKTLVHAAEVHISENNAPTARMQSRTLTCEVCQQYV